MKKNVGSIERIIRIIAGFVIISLVFVGPQSPWRTSASSRWQRVSWLVSALCAPGRIDRQQEQLARFRRMSSPNRRSIPNLVVPGRVFFHRID